MQLRCGYKCKHDSTPLNDYKNIEITICLYGEKPCQKFVYLNTINILLSFLIASYAINNFYCNKKIINEHENKRSRNR